MKKSLLFFISGILTVAMPVAMAAAVFYPDVSMNEWYFGAVQRLNEKGIMTGYPDQTFKPSNTVNRAELAVTMDRLINYLERNESGDTVFDSCNKLSTYQNQIWFNKLNLKYQNEFLKPGDAGGSLMSEFGEGCLAVDQNLFIFIPEYFEFGCGKILSYDIQNDILKIPTITENYCASEFGKRVGDYVPFRGFQADAGTCWEFLGQYYFKENRVEFTKNSC
jgi:hypothetical protein